MPETSRDLTSIKITRLIQNQKPAGKLLDPLRPAAVLVPLVLEGDQWHLLFTRRAETLTNHRGQVSFPGGVVEPGDSSAEETALREAHEEIGLLPGDVSLLGRLAHLQTVSNYLITPVLGIVRWPYEFRLSPFEVSRVFTIPLDWLADPSHWEERPYTSHSGYSEKVIYFHPYDGEILWGASARITVELLKALQLV